MRCTALITALLAFNLTAVATAATGADASTRSWQTTRLFAPTQADRKHEQKGRVMIYDGLRDKDVDRALDEQFERAQHMMFTRVVATDERGQPRRDENGEVMTFGDDGCD